MGLAPRDLAVPVRRISNENEGSPHFFVTNAGKKMPLRGAGAMEINFRSWDAITTLLNNLSAKVTKAVRQNGGQKSIAKQPESVAKEEEPRFVKRTPFRLFKWAGKFSQADGR